MEVLYHIRPYFVGIFHQFRPWMYEYGRWPIDDSTIYHDWPTLFNDSLVHTTQMTTWCGSWLVSQVNTHFGCNLTGLDDPTKKHVQLNYRWLPMFIDVFFFPQGTRIIWWRGTRKTAKDAPRLRLTGMTCGAVLGQHLALVFGALPPAVMPSMFCKSDWGPGGHFRQIAIISLLLGMFSK